MPYVEIRMIAGRTPDQKRDLVKNLTDAVVTSIGADPAAVRVDIVEIERHHIAKAGVLMSEA